MRYLFGASCFAGKDWTWRDVLRNSTRKKRKDSGISKIHSFVSKHTEYFHISSALFFVSFFRFFFFFFTFFRSPRAAVATWLLLDFPKVLCGLLSCRYSSPGSPTPCFALGFRLPHRVYFSCSQLSFRSSTCRQV